MFNQLINLVFLFLPETLGKKLPESMDEALLLGMIVSNR